MVCPFLAVSCFQGSFDQPQEAIVLDVFSEDVHQDVVIDVIVTTLDVSFDKPLGPCPCFMDIYQGRLASLVRSESVAVL